MPTTPAEMLGLSTKLLAQIEGKKPDEAAPALLFALGRLAGRYGVKTRSAAEFWTQHTNEAAKSLFVMGFEVERKAAPAVVEVPAPMRKPR